MPDGCQAESAFRLFNIKLTGLIEEDDTQAVIVPSLWLMSQWDEKEMESYTWVSVSSENYVCVASVLLTIKLKQ